MPQALQEGLAFTENLIALVVRPVNDQTRKDTQGSRTEEAYQSRDGKPAWMISLHRSLMSADHIISEGTSPPFCTKRGIPTHQMANSILPTLLAGPRQK